MSFKRAERKRVFLKLAVTGPSGSGKTLSSLLIAKGLGGKVAVVDTENRSASLYADRKDLGEYDVLEIDPPYTVDRYIQAINDAVTAKYDVLVIDSLTHQWAGEGGLLSVKEKMDQRPSSNSYTNWAKMTPEHERFKNAILHSPIHVIGTMRSKQDYILETNDKGKQAPRKVGMAPIQREGMEYEFTVMLDLDMNHTAEASKDRTSLFDKQLFTPTVETGKKLMAWLQTGKDSTPVVIPVIQSVSAVLPVADPVQQAQKVDESIHDNSGEMICTFGKKYLGKKIKEIDPVELDKYLTFFDDSAKKQGKPLTGVVLDFYNASDSYLRSVVKPEPLINESDIVSWDNGEVYK